MVSAARLRFHRSCFNMTDRPVIVCDLRVKLLLRVSGNLIDRKRKLQMTGIEHLLYVSIHPNARGRRRAVILIVPPEGEVIDDRDDCQKAEAHSGDPEPGTDIAPIASPLT